jgi:NAD(P)-dependent dehydrogenase (short-subunit alcohol dehydrogenase family)
VIEREQGIDILVNNAGMSLVGAVEETSVQEAQALFDVNVLGLLHQPGGPAAHAPSGPWPHPQRQFGAGLPAGPLHGVICGLQACRGGAFRKADHETRQFGVRVVLIDRPTPAPAWTLAPKAGRDRRL